MRNSLIYGLFILLMGCVKSSPVPTAPISPTPVITIPNAPTDLKGVLSSPNQMDLTWSDASNNEDGFKIERKSGAEAFTLLTSVGQNIASYSDKGLNAGINYTYRVYSYNTKGNSTNSNEIAVKTEDAEVGLLRVGLVAYYPFTGNAGDSSGNGNHGTVNGASLNSDRNGKSNSAYSFNKSLSNYITLPLLNGLNGASKASFSFWVKTNKSNNSGTIFGHWSNNNGGVGVNCGLNIETIAKNQIGIFNYSGTGGIFTNTLDSAKWQHVVALIDFTQSTNISKVKVIINNISQNLTFQEFNNLIGSATSTFIGRRNTDFDTYGNYFDGIIDDVRIHNRILTEQEITYLFKN